MERTIQTALPQRLRQMRRKLFGGERLVDDRSVDRNAEDPKIAREVARAVLAAPEPGPAQTAALRGYQEIRDRLSRPMLAVVERIASYEWDLEGVRGLLRALSGAMTEEVELLAGLPAAA